MATDNNRPAEVEITPEMIEAGMHEYGVRWCGLVDADDSVAREMLRAAYSAMNRLRPKPSRLESKIIPYDL